MRRAASAQPDVGLTRLGPGEDARLFDDSWMAPGPGGELHIVSASTAWNRPGAFAADVGERPA